ncbi:MAG TPA: condensation domain-containing protein, partial [Thermoanaerobaculia bacterium]|nr:condensation domain-containing protein [Thermoanaerobaculia bacterium]
MAELENRRAALSPKKQALLAQRLRSEVRRDEPPPIPRRAAAGPARLSFAQERLWFLAQWQPGGTAYNLLDVIRLAGRLDVAALAAALRLTVERHESLRTVFVEAAGVPFQRVGPVPGQLLPLVDLSALPHPRCQATAHALAAAQAGVAFDLARGPLFRARLLRLGEHEHLLVLVTHHIVADLWSFGVLIGELSSGYDAARAGRRQPLAALPLQYADWSVWQRSWLTGEVLERRLAYWRRQLAGAPQVLELPADRPRPAAQRFRGALLPFSLPAPLGTGLRAAAQAVGATPFMAFFTAFAVLLHRCSGQDDLLVGSPVAGRTRPELARLVGLFVNTLVLRTGLEGDPTLLELLGRVRETVLGALAHQDLPFEGLVDELQPFRDPSRPPLVQVMFVFQDVPAPAPGLSGLTLTPLVDFDSGTAKVDLTMVLTESGGGIAGVVEYDIDLFDRTRIQRFAAHFRQLLEALAAEPRRRVSSCCLLSPAERHQLVVEWNAGCAGPVGAATTVGMVDAAGAATAAPCLHELFAAQAARTPEAVAVVCEGEHLSYGALAARAGRLAARLRRLGVGAETRVGLCVERSLAMVEGIVGILAAGGAYVPL